MLVDVLVDWTVSSMVVEWVGTMVDWKVPQMAG